jgi:hypothetical protein
VNVRATGPGPLRTARGAGRVLLVERPRLELERLVLRDRVLEPPRFAVPDRLEPALLLLDEDVLLLRDPGGEDVRVAMVINLGHRHTSHRDHRSVSERQPRTTPAGEPSRRRG